MCKKRPTSAEDLIRSIALADHVYTAAQLKKISARIQAGQPAPEVPPERMDQLRVASDVSETCCRRRVAVRDPRPIAWRRTWRAHVGDAIYYYARIGERVGHGGQDGGGDGLFPQITHAGFAGLRPQAALCGCHDC